MLQCSTGEIDKIANLTLRKITIGDREKIGRFLSSRRTMACDYNFVNLFCWGEIYDIRWAVRDGTLVLHSGRDDLLFEPIGNGVSARDVISISDEFRRRGLSGNYSIVHGDFLAARPELKDQFHEHRDRDNANYIYRAKDLCELRGNKLHRKKNLLSQFRRNNPGYVCREMEKGDREECFDLAEEWCDEKYCETVGYEHERSALRRALDHYDKLGIRGFLIERGGRKIAFSIVSRQREDTAAVHFEKYDRGVKGSAQAINWETARRLGETYEYINREQDLGIEGLRRAKLSYRPALMVETFTLSRRPS